MRQLTGRDRLHRFMQAKIERDHAQDRADVESMVRSGLVAPTRLRELFDEVEGDLYRYPAIDPASFRRALEDALARTARPGRPPSA